MMSLSHSVASATDFTARARRSVEASNPDRNWRGIPDWPEYQVSDRGDVRRIGNATGAVVGRILKPLLNKKTGYFAVCLCRNSTSVRVDIHRLVALAFHGPQPSANYLVAHNDGCRTNNCAANLRWATQRENLRDCREHGTAQMGALNPLSADRQN
jgi:hypothetical protein